MEFKNITTSIEESYSIKPENQTYPYTFKVSGDTTNCKLSYIHGIGNLNGFLVKDRKEVFNFLLNKCKGCVILNTIDSGVAKWIVKNYPTYYYNQPPIGYSGGVQHHICIKNTLKNNTSCRNPSPLIYNITKDQIKNNLINILKRKRRKSDYIDEFINSL